MTQSEFIEYVADVCGGTKDDVSYSLGIILECIMKKVASGEPVKFYGFGCFEQRRKKAYIGTNPKTREAVEVEARSVPVFRPGEGFKRAVDIHKKPRVSGA